MLAAHSGPPITPSLLTSSIYSRVDRKNFTMVPEIETSQLFLELYRFPLKQRPRATNVIFFPTDVTEQSLRGPFTEQVYL